MIRLFASLLLCPALGFFAPDVRAGFQVFVDPAGVTAGGQFAYTTIQAGVNAATPGSTVVVDAGTYNEDVTISQVGITLSGAQAGVNPVAGRSGAESILNGTITITGAGAAVDGFTVNANSQWALEVGGAGAPSVAATHSLIQNNIVYSTIYGIQIGAQGGPSTPQVELDSVVRNNFLRTGNAEVWIPNSSGNTIEGNRIQMTPPQAGSGIEIYYSNNNLVSGNEIDNSPSTPDYAAIRLRGAQGNLVEYNFGVDNALPPIIEGEGSGGNVYIHNFDGVSAVPEPSSLVLALISLGCGTGCFALRRRRP